MLAPFAAAAVRRGVHVYHLNIGQPDFETPPAVRQAIRDFAEPIIAYAPSLRRFESHHFWASMLLLVAVVAFAVVLIRTGAYIGNQVGPPIA